MQNPTRYFPAPPGGSYSSAAPMTAEQAFVQQPSQHPIVENARAYNGYQKTHSTLPELYNNQVIAVNDIVTGLVLEAPIAVLQYLLPIQYDPTGANVLEWDETMFNHVYAGETPPEAPPRLVTVERTRHRQRLRRIALAMVGEEGALSTAEGIDEAELRARGLTLAIVETIILSAIEQIVAAGDNQMLMSPLYVRNNNPIEQAQHEAELTGAVQKGEKAMAHAFAKFRAELRGTEAVTGRIAMLAPPDLLVHFSEPTESTIAALGLEEAIVRSGMFNRETTAVYLDMLVVRMPDISGIAQTTENPGIVAAAQSISSETAFAEWNSMCWSSTGRSVYDGVHVQDRTAILTTDQRDIWVYNADTDSMSRVSFAEAVMACGIAQPIFSAKDVEPAKLAVNDPSKRRGAPPNFYLHALNGRAQVAVADFAGQLDPNVYGVEDMVATAKQIQGKLVNVAGVGTGDLYARTHALLARLDAAPVVDSFCAALANVNANLNTRTVGGVANFYGEDPAQHPDAAANGWASTVQWKATADGGMVLPSVAQVKAVSLNDNDIEEGAVPPFMACWTGLCALRTLHQTGTRGWNKEVCAEASAIVDGWAKLAACIDPAGANPLVNDLYRHAWQLNAQPGAALFGLAFGGRVPVFLPARSVGGAESDTVQQRASDSIVVGLPTYYASIAGQAPQYDLGTFGGAPFRGIDGAQIRNRDDIYTDATVRALFRLNRGMADKYAYMMARVYRDDRGAVGIATSFADKLASLSEENARNLVGYLWSEKLGLPMTAGVSGSFGAPALSGAEAPEISRIVDALREGQEMRITTAGMPKSIRATIDTIVPAAHRAGPSVDKAAAEPILYTEAADGTRKRVPFTAIPSEARVNAPALAPNSKYFRTPFEAGPSQVQQVLATEAASVLLGNPDDGFKTPKIFERNAPIPADFLRIPEMRPLGRYHSARGADGHYLHHQRLHSVTQASAPGDADGAEMAGAYEMPGLIGDRRAGTDTELGRILDVLVCQNLMDRIAGIIMHSSSMLAVIMLGLLGMSISNPAAVAACLDNDVHLFWLNIFLLRPLLTYRCDSIIMMRPGEQTGRTILGHRNVAAGMNAALQNMLQSLVVYTGSVITQPKNIRRLRNVRIAAYLGGGGARIAKIDNLADQLSGDPSAFPGFIAYPIGMAERDFAPYLPVAGTFPDQSVVPEGSRGPQWSSAEYYNEVVYGIARLVNGPARGIYHNEVNVLPFVAARGTQVNQAAHGQRSIVHGRSWRGIVASCPTSASASNGERAYPAIEVAQKMILDSAY